MHAPALTGVQVNGSGDNFVSSGQLQQPSLDLRVAGGSTANVADIGIAKADLTANGIGTSSVALSLTGSPNPQGGVFMDGSGTVSFGQLGELDLTTSDKCDEGDAFVFVSNGIDTLNVNGAPVPLGTINNRAMRPGNTQSASNCVAFGWGAPVPVYND